MKPKMINQNYFLSFRFFVVMTLVGILLQSKSADAQNEIAGLKKYSESQYGTSNMLVNGWKYFPDHFNAEGNPYFEDMEWETGNIETTLGNFDNLLLRFNVQMDELILQEVLQNGQTAFVMLNPDFLKWFSFDGHHFVNADVYYRHSGLEGYVEVIYSGKLKYLAKHRKMFVANYSAGNPFGSISGQNTNYYLLIGDEKHKISSKRNLIKLFPAHKKEINRYLKNEKIRFKKAENDDLTKLMEYLDNLK